MTNEQLTYEELERIRKTWEARRVFEWVGTNPPMESTHPEVVEVLDLLDEVERLRKAPTITDEMVERAAEACYLASFKEDAFGRQWDKACEKYPDAADLYRREARAVLEAALGGDES